MEAARTYTKILIFYTNDVYYFPTKEVVFYNGSDAISGDLRWARLKVLKELFKMIKKDNSNPQLIL